jgi:hypothetical protein
VNLRELRTGEVVRRTPLPSTPRVNKGKEGLRLGYALLSG